MREPKHEGFVRLHTLESSEESRMRWRDNACDAWALADERKGELNRLTEQLDPLSLRIYELEAELEVHKQKSLAFDVIMAELDRSRT